MTNKTNFSVAEQQERFIESARKLLKPSPVRLHHVPRWLVARIKEKIGKPHGTYASKEEYLYFAQRTVDSMGSFIDHWGTTKWGDTQYFVTEPYLSPRHLQNALDFAKILELDLRISSNSWWYPGHTTRLMFSLPTQESP